MLLPRYCSRVILVCWMLCVVLIGGTGVWGRNEENNRQFEAEILPLLLARCEDEQSKASVWAHVGEQYAWWGNTERAQYYYQKVDEVLDSLSTYKKRAAVRFLASPDYISFRSVFLSDNRFGRDYDWLAERVNQEKNPRLRKRLHSLLLEQAAEEMRDDVVLRLYAQNQDVGKKEKFMVAEAFMRVGQYEQTMTLLDGKDAYEAWITLVWKNKIPTDPDRVKQLLKILETFSEKTEDESRRMNGLIAMIPLYFALGETESLDRALREVRQWEEGLTQDELFSSGIAKTRIYMALRRAERLAEAEKTYAELLNHLKSVQEGRDTALTIVMLGMQVIADWERMEELLKVDQRETLTIDDPTRIHIIMETAIENGRADVARRWMQYFHDKVESTPAEKRVLVDFMSWSDVVNGLMKVGDYKQTLPYVERIVSISSLRELYTLEIAMRYWAHEQYVDEDIRNAMQKHLQALVSAKDSDSGE